MARAAHGFFLKTGISLSAVMLLTLVAIQSVRADQNDQRLPPLLNELATDGLPAKTQDRLEAQIWKIWHEHESPTIAVLLADATGAMRAGKHVQALKQLNAVVDLAPNFAEGWNQRATLLYLIGDLEASAADIAKTLSLEPRHFGALSGLGLIFDRLKRPRAALRAYRKALEIHPGLKQAEQRIKKLANEVEQDI